MQFYLFWKEKCINMRKRIEVFERHQTLLNGDTKCCIDNTILEAWNCISDTFLFCQKICNFVVNDLFFNMCLQKFFFLLNRVHSNTRSR